MRASMLRRPPVLAAWGSACTGTGLKQRLGRQQGLALPQEGRRAAAAESGSCTGLDAGCWPRTHHLALGLGARAHDGDVALCARALAVGADDALAHVGRFRQPAARRAPGLAGRSCGRMEAALWSGGGWSPLSCQVHDMRRSGDSRAGRPRRLTCGPCRGAPAPAGARTPGWTPGPPLGPRGRRSAGLAAGSTSPARTRPGPLSPSAQGLHSQAQGQGVGQTPRAGPRSQHGRAEHCGAWRLGHRPDPRGRVPAGRRAPSAARASRVPPPCRRTSRAAPWGGCTTALAWDCFLDFLPMVSDPGGRSPSSARSN